jgi:hypothetical protein
MDINIHNVSEIRAGAVRHEDGYEVRKIVFITDEQDGSVEHEVTCFTRTNGGATLKMKVNETKEI